MFLLKKEIPTMVALFVILVFIFYCILMRSCHYIEQQVCLVQLVVFQHFR